MKPAQGQQIHGEDGIPIQAPAPCSYPPQCSLYQTSEGRCRILSVPPSNLACTCFCKQGFTWNWVTPICLHIVSLCFQAPGRELSSPGSAQVTPFLFLPLSIFAHTYTDRPTDRQQTGHQGSLLLPPEQRYKPGDTGPSSVTPHHSRIKLKIRYGPPSCLHGASMPVMPSPSLCSVENVSL